MQFRPVWVTNSANGQVDPTDDPPDKGLKHLAFSVLGASAVYSARLVICPPSLLAPE
jgi:hypothetical protein